MYASRRKIEAFDAALSGLPSGARSPRAGFSRELALAGALGAAGAQIAAAMPSQAMNGLRANLMSMAAHSTASTAASSAASVGHAAAGATKVTAAKTGLLGTKLGSLLGSAGAGISSAAVVPVAVGAIAANLVVATAAVTSHSSIPSSTASGIVASAPASAVLNAVSPVAKQLHDQVTLLTSLEHISLTPAQATQFLQQWSARTQTLISVSGVRAAVRSFTVQVQTELDRLSAVLPTEAVTQTRTLLTNAVAALPLLVDQLVATPTSLPTTGATSAPTPAPTSAATSAPTSQPTTAPTSAPTSQPTLAPHPTVLPPIQVPGIDIGPIKVPPIQLPGVHL